MSCKTLADLNLKGFENRVTHRLSGGEKKMVALATILVMRPNVLLLDEPTSGLDEKTISRIMHILNHLDISYVIVSHEYDFLSRTTTDIFRMSQGRIEYDGPSKNLHSHYHRHHHYRSHDPGHADAGRSGRRFRRVPARSSGQRNRYRPGGRRHSRNRKSI